MTKSKFIQANKKIEEKVVQGYKAVEDSVVNSFSEIENKFVDLYLAHDGESLEEAKQRLKKENQLRKDNKK